MQVFGIDVGGSGIKGAPVDVKKGKLLSEHVRFETPNPSTPKAIAEAAALVMAQFKWKGPVGITLPAVVKGERVLTAANISKKWLNVEAQTLFKKALKSKVFVLNDADAAGIAEMRFGAGKNEGGLVQVVTLGTGIGSALFYRGVLIPNTEFGHLTLEGKDAERLASNSVRERKDISWKKWGRHVDEYLELLEYLISPDLFIIGGGISKHSDKFFPFINRRADVVPAKFLNDAGIIGAALAAAEYVQS